MSKPKRERSLADNEAKAVARMLRVSPQKLNLVAQLIRGRKASAALADLQFSRKRIAVDVKKCLESAIANAENNHDLDVDDLIVSEAHVGNGIVMKRFAPRGRGRRAVDGHLTKAPELRQRDHIRQVGHAKFHKGDLAALSHTPTTPTPWGRGTTSPTPTPGIWAEPSRCSNRPWL